MWWQWVTKTLSEKVVRIKIYVNLQLYHISRASLLPTHDVFYWQIILRQYHCFLKSMTFSFLKSMPRLQICSNLMSHAI
jgi:hypothetical protein